LQPASDGAGAIRAGFVTPRRTPPAGHRAFHNPISLEDEAFVDGDDFDDLTGPRTPVRGRNLGGQTYENAYPSVGQVRPPSRRRFRVAFTMEMVLRGGAAARAGVLAMLCDTSTPVGAPHKTVLLHRSSTTQNSDGNRAMSAIGTATGGQPAIQSARNDTAPNAARTPQKHQIEAVDIKAYRSGGPTCWVAEIRVLGKTDLCWASFSARKLRRMHTTVPQSSISATVHG